MCTQTPKPEITGTPCRSADLEATLDYAFPPYIYMVPCSFHLNFNFPA